jgi:putative ABC transport system permease protein
VSVSALRRASLDVFAGIARGDVPLAWRNLVSDRGRLLRAAAGIGFAVLLMLMQLGFRTAFMDSAMAVIRALDGDIFLMNPAKNRFGSKETFPRSQLYQARGIAGVASVYPLYAEWNDTLWKNPQNGQAFNVQVLAFNPDQPVFLLPEINRHLEALKQPGAVIADARGRRFLGEFAPGVESELGRTRVQILDTVPFGPDFVIDGTIIMSDRNFLRIYGRNRVDPELTRVEFGIVKLEPGADPVAVQKALTAALPPSIVAVTRQDLLAIEETYQSGVAPVGPIFGLGVVIGFLVGMMISYQILFADLSDQLPQYATLKAIGYGRGFLVKTVIQQAVLYGLAGFIPAWILASALYWVAGEITLLPMQVTFDITIKSLLLTIGMCIVSGLVVVRRVIDADPAEVF